MKQCPNCKTQVLSIKEAANQKNRKDLCFQQGNKIVCLKCNTIFNETEDGTTAEQGIDPMAKIVDAVYERIQAEDKSDQAKSDQAESDQTESDQAESDQTESDQTESDQDGSNQDEGRVSFGITDGDY